MPNDQEKVVKIPHKHKFEFDYAEPDKTVFSCTDKGCDAILIEPEDAGTGA